MRMSHDEFTKLFQHLQKLEDKMDKGFENAATKDEMQIILNRLDSIEKQLEISEDERLVMGHQLTRLQTWAEKAAKRINVPFSQ
jgi:hypothetical protein